MAFEEGMQRVLKQLRRFARRNSEAHGKHFAPVVKVPAKHMQFLAGIVSAEDGSGTAGDTFSVTSRKESCIRDTSNDFWIS